MIRRIGERRLGSLLMDSGIINQRQLDEALFIHNDGGSKSFIGEILVELGYADEKDILSAFLKQYKAPYLDISRYAINSEVANIIPFELAQKYTLIPLDKFDDFLLIGMSNPINNQALKEVNEIFPIDKVHIFLASPTQIKKAIEELYNKKTGKYYEFQMLPHDNS